MFACVCMCVCMCLMFLAITTNVENYLAVLHRTLYQPLLTHKKSTRSPQKGYVNCYFKFKNVYSKDSGNPDSFNLHGPEWDKVF